MRMLDEDSRRPLRNVALYLDPSIAHALIRYLQELLEDPEAREHRHILDPSGRSALSFSIITPKKLKELDTWTEAERDLLQGEWAFSGSNDPSGTAPESRGREAAIVVRALPIALRGIAEVPRVVAEDTSARELESFLRDNATHDVEVDKMVRALVERALADWRSRK